MNGLPPGVAGTDVLAASGLVAHATVHRPIGDRTDCGELLETLTPLTGFEAAGYGTRPCRRCRWFSEDFQLATPLNPAAYVPRSRSAAADDSQARPGAGFPIKEFR
jgi:hypothetical protein